MSCKKSKDVCEDCLENKREIKMIKIGQNMDLLKMQEIEAKMDKIQSQIEKICDQEEEEEEEEEVWRPRKTSSEKANDIFLATCVLAATGYVAFWNAKFLLTTARFGVDVAKSIFRNLDD